MMHHIEMSAGCGFVTFDSRAKIKNIASRLIASDQQNAHRKFSLLKAPTTAQIVTLTSFDLGPNSLFEWRWGSLKVSNFVSKHPGAFALGQSVFELAQGCYAYETLSLVAHDPKAEIIIPNVPVGEGPQAKLTRTDGSFHSFDIRHYLNLAKNHSLTNEHIIRSWYLGALITVGDLLKAKSYFDHQPEFELIYHLRNGVAHGNQFNIEARGKRRLRSHSACLRWFDQSERFKISTALDGKKVLFDFVGPGDVADILTLTAERLKDLERGILGPGVYTSIFG